MRRSICTCEPSFTHAGTVSNWKFIFTPSINLPAKCRLRFDLLSEGRDTDWEIPTADSNEEENCIWATLPNNKTIPAEEVEQNALISCLFEFVLPSEVKAGEALTINIGTKLKKKSDIEEHGNRSQCYVQRRKMFHLYVDPKGKGEFKDPEIFTIDVKGGELHNIQVITPSLVSKNQRFDILLRFEDLHGNLTGNAPEGTLIELSYAQLRESLKWKLFVPETGFLNLPNLYFNEEGIYIIELLNPQTKQKFHSAPIACFFDEENGIFWGSLHAESEKIDATDNIESCLRLHRDENAWSFFGTSSFENPEETSSDHWRSIGLHVSEINEDNRFNVFQGFQWVGEKFKEGIRQLVYLKDQKPLLHRKDAKSSSLKKIYKAHPSKEILSVPSLTMSSKHGYHFEDFNPEHECVIEIYNAWGSSECTEKEGNMRPISGGKDGDCENPAGSIRNALNKNCRFGFVAGGLDDRAIYSSYFETDQEQYSPGLTAIISPEHTREALFQALQRRSCYATTGPRIIVGFFIAGFGMGSEISTKQKPGLTLNRHISGYVAGEVKIAKVEFLRNGEIFHTIQPEDTKVDFAIDDTSDLEKIILQSSDDRPPFIYYYIRVTQEDGHIAWSSPIWIDHNATPGSTKRPKPEKKK